MNTDVQVPEHTQHSAAALGLTDQELAAFLESAKRNGKGPSLPEIAPPANLVGAMIFLLVDNHGTIPADFARYEPDGFSTGLMTLKLHGYPTELRGKQYYLSKPEGALGSLSHLRAQVDTMPSGLAFRARCALDAHALLARIAHYEDVAELEAEAEARAAQRQRREQRKNTATTGGEHAHG